MLRGLIVCLKYLTGEGKSGSAAKCIQISIICSGLLMVMPEP